MRNHTLISFGILCITALACFGQTTDPQWFIKYNKKKICNSTSSTTYDSWSPSNTVTLSKVRGADASRSGTRNDVFAIFSDNSYFSSRNLNGWNTDRVNNPPLINMELAGPKIVEYLYLTNTYETDDPDACVDNSTTPSLIKPFRDTITKDILSTNHNIVKSRDVTLIINIKEMLPACGSGTFNLCFDTIIDENGARSSALNLLELRDSRIFNGNRFMKNTTGGFTFSDLCIRNLSPTTSLEYINLKVPDIIPENLKNGDKLLFYIEGCPASELAESIRDSHDPNFVRVDCVSEVDGKKYAKYTISTFNETADAVLSLTFDFVPPSAWDGKLPTKVATTVTDGSNLQAKQATINSGYINFPFTGILEGKQTATLTFCLELNSSFDLEYGNLELYNPLIGYDGTPYPIYDFKDIYEYEGSVDDTIAKPHVIHSNVTKRPVSSFKNCGCGTPLPPPRKCLFEIGTWCILWSHVSYLIVVLLIVGFIGKMVIK